MSGPNGPASGPAIRWLPDGSAIDALVSDRGSTQVVRFTPGKGKPTVLTAPGRHVTSFDHVDGEGLVIAVTDPTTPSHLRLVSNEPEIVLADFNERWLAEVGIATPEEFWFESNGRAIQGWLLRPTGNSAKSPECADDPERPRRPPLAVQPRILP